MRRLREQLDDGAWQGARSIHDEYVTHICVFFFTNSIHAHTAQLYSFAETHEVCAPGQVLIVQLNAVRVRLGAASASMAYTASSKRLQL
jgi:hypothetical protein